MKRVRVLAVLLGVLGMSFPLLSFAAPAGECMVGYCAAGSTCPDGSLCNVAPGQNCAPCDL